MKNLIKYLVVLLAVCFITITTKAQDSLTIYDLHVQDTYSIEDSGSSEFVVSIYFKINKVAQASKVVILLGTSPDSGDVKLAKYDVLLKDGFYGFWVGNNFNKVFGQRVNVAYLLSKKDFIQLKWVTVYAMGTNGSITEKKQFECKSKNK